jgi:adhesin/invasin
MRPGTLDGVRRGALLGLAVVLQITCNQAILTAPTDATMTVVVNPPFVPAHGGVSVVSALVVESIGTPVADGTVVQFFTNLGQIEEQGKTNDGVARVNFVSDARSGTATVTAFSGTVTGTGEIRVGSILPERVVVTAAPPRLTDSRTSQIVAVVLDIDGNPVPNVPVFFSTTGSTESMESGGQAVFTDNDGRARDVLRTRHPRELVAKSVVVTATTANGKTGSTTVTID